METLRIPTWKILNDLMKGTPRKEIFPDTFKTSEGLVTGSDMVAASFNDFFTNISKELSTVNRGNFERRGNFEHRSLFPFNDLCYQNGRVCQKLYFSLVVSFIVTTSTTKMCTYEVKLWSKK